MVGVGPRQVLAGHVLAVEVAEDVELGPARGHLLLADDRVARARGWSGRRRWIWLGLYSIRYERDRLQAVGPVQRQRVGRVPADRDRHGLLGARSVLAGQDDVGPRVEVLLPLLLEVGDRIGGEGRGWCRSRSRPAGPTCTAAGAWTAPGAQRPVDHRGVVLAVGQDAELERADVRQHLLDFLDLLVAGLGQDDLDPVAADLADRDLLDALGSARCLRAEISSSMLKLAGRFSWATS